MSEETGKARKMSLEEYKNEVYKHLTEKLHFSIEVAKGLMTDYNDRFQEYYEDDWSVALVTTAMIAGD